MHLRQILLAAALASAGAIALADGPVYDAKSFGAKGDGVTKDTGALQAAIDSCAVTGGTVRLQDGVFLSGMVTLRSNVHLEIDATATLKGTQDDADYPDTTPRSDNRELGSCRKTLVYAEGASNVTIDGGGTIDGNGKKPEWMRPYTERPERTRPMAIYVVQSSHVAIRDLAVKDAAMWAVVALETDDVEVARLNVDTPLGVTRDGIDLVDCHRALVEGCTIFSGDDAICLKTGTARGLEDVTVRKNHIRQSTVANGLKLGTASRGGFHRVTFEDIVVENCDKAAMAVESVDGAPVTSITFRGIEVHDTGTAVFVLLGLRSGGKVGSIDGVTFEHIRADRMKHSWGSAISGTTLDGKTYPLRNVTFEDVHLTYEGEQSSIPADPPEYAGQYPDPNLWETLPAAGLFVRHVEGLTLHDSTIQVHGHDARSAIVERDVTRVRAP
jgi:polygalacturonase